MAIKLFSFCALFLLMFSLTKVNSADINYQLLNPTVQNFSSRISSGSIIATDEIKESFDFIHYHCTSIKWEPQDFYALLEKTVPTVETAVAKFGHNRFGIFVNDCKKLFEKDILEDKERFALFTLLTQLQQKINFLLKNIDTTVEDESRIPDEQFSFLFDLTQARSRSSSVLSTTSTQHISGCESASEDSDRHTKTDELNDATFCFVCLDGRALEPTSFVYYQKKLPDNQFPLCITCNLQSVTIEKINTLKEAIQKINDEKNLQEIVFTNGSSKKFNLLFAFLKDVAERRTAEKPITIVYSTTSESQKAYKKLSTLRGIIHKAPDVRELTDQTKIKNDSIHACQRITSDFSDESTRLIHSILEIHQVQKI